MTTLDFILIALLLISLVSGFRKGILVQLGGLTGLAAGIWLAYRYGDRFGVWLGIDSDIAYYCAFILIVLASIAAMGLLGWFVGKIFGLVGLGLLNRVGGMVLSLGMNVLILGMLLMAFHSINRQVRIVSERQFSESALCGPIVRLTDAALPFLRETFGSIDFTGQKQP